MFNENLNYKDCLCLNCEVFCCDNCAYCMSINYGNSKRSCSQHVQI